MKFPKYDNMIMQDLLNARTKLAEEIHTLASVETISRSDDDRLTECLDEMEVVKVQCAERITTLAARDAARSRSDGGSPGYDDGGRSTRRTSIDYNDVRGMKADELRSTALKVLETSGKNLDPHQLDHVDMLLRSNSEDVDGSMVARRLLVTERAAYKSAFTKILNSVAHFSPEENSALDEFRAMNEGTGSAGQYGVPVMIDPTIILTSGASVAPILDLARVVTITTDAWKGVSGAPAVWSWDAEGSAVSDDSLTLAQPNIPIYTARGFVPFSLELGMDYPGYQDEITKALAAGYLDLIAKSTAIGTGVASPTGIFQAMLNSTTNPAHVVVTTNGALGALDIRKMWAALPERFKPNATWVMSSSVENQLANDTSALSLSALSVNPLLNSIPSLFGRSLRLTDWAPAYTGTTAAASILVLGDFSGFVVAQRAGLNVELVPLLFDTVTGRPTGQRGLFAFVRSGSDAANPNAFRMLTNT